MSWRTAFPMLRVAGDRHKTGSLPAGLPTVLSSSERDQLVGGCPL